MTGDLSTSRLAQFYIAHGSSIEASSSECSISLVIQKQAPPPKHDMSHINNNVENVIATIARTSDAEGNSEDNHPKEYHNSINRCFPDKSITS